MLSFVIYDRVVGDVAICIEVGASEERGVARNQTVPAGNPRGDLVTARGKKNL